MMFSAAVDKEFKLVFRDLHSVLVLFVMPAVFIIIMSLALQDQFADKKALAITVLYTKADDSPAATQLISLLKTSAYFQFVETPVLSDKAGILQRLGDDSQVLLSIPANLPALLNSGAAQSTAVRLRLSPRIDSRTRLLLEAQLRSALIQTKLAAAGQGSAGVTNWLGSDVIESEYLSEMVAKPSAVQQNVPAWLIFSMFFVVIPVSTTLITERQQGTLLRLRTMNISMSLFLIAKALPYLLINQLQLLIMLLLGVYIVPLLGGDSLSIGHHYAALMLVSLAVGVAAIGYALLVAVVAKTTAQAASLGGVGNILLAAIGGIMVPVFVMPEYLQPFAQLSPMAWALDGFLAVLLYGDGITAIVPAVLKLLVFGGVMLGLALLLVNKK